MVATTPTQQNARVTRTVRAYRRRLVALEQQAQRQIATSYQWAFDILMLELETALTNAERAIASGRDANTFRVQRAVELVQQAEQLLAQAARQTGIQISNQRMAAGQLALQAAGDLLDAHLGAPPPDLPNASSFMGFPRAAVETITGSLADGPVRELLDRYGSAAAREAGRILTGAIVTGQHPRTISKQLAAALNTPHWQAARLARTEINRAYRESLRETWAANKAITPQWEWVSGQNSRTCAVCWAMDGQRFDSDEPMGTHPNCRCCLSPISIGWNDLAAKYGVTMPPGDWDPPPRPTGPEVFATLPAIDQRKVLGPAKYAAYAAGDIDLADLVETSHSADWGTTRREGSLARALKRSGRGGPPAPPVPPAWRPTMPRAEAEAFAAQGDLTRPLYHVTDPAGEAGITRQGFDLTRRRWGRVWGNGVYMSDSPDAETMYRSGFTDPRKLELRVFSRKTLRVSVSNVPDGQWGYHTVLDAVGIQAHVRYRELTNQLVKERDAFERNLLNRFPAPNVYDYKSVSAAQAQRQAAAEQAERDGRYTPNPPAEAFVRTLREFGYDAIDLVDEPFRATVGGSQVIVFDPERVVVVEP